MKAIYVDGNDVMATYLACKTAIEMARNGEPVLIEAFTYRLGDHTTSDNAKLYREDSEVESWLPKEPVKRLKDYLLAEKLWTEEEENWLSVCRDEADKIAEESLNAKLLNPLNMFDKLYENLTPELERQKEELKNELLQTKSERI